MTEEAPKKRPVGRPSKYKPEYCERIIQLADEGKGPAEYAVDFGIDRTTLYDWAAAHEDFSTALSRAKTHEQAWWEKAARGGMYLDKFNALVWKTSVQARFRDDYTERKVTEVSGPGGDAIKFEAKTVDARALDPDQREALKQILLAAKGESK
jgi:transposase